MLIDSHCHLDFPELKSDISGVISRAMANGVERFLTISVTISGLHEVMKVASVNERIYASIGLHPCYVTKERPISWRQISSACVGPKIIGIGETGLDYYHPSTDKNTQKINFIEHIKAAQETGLPLIVHTRDADQDTLGILQEQMQIKSFKCLIHCFTASSWFAKECLKLGCFISVSGIISFKNAVELHETVKALPLDRLLVETDAPYLAPVPFRGKRNEPAFVKHVAETLAKLKGVSYDEVAKVTGDNFFTLFSKVARP